MSEIKVGDLVYVAKPGCSERNLGITFTVRYMTDSEDLPGCVVCGKNHGTGKFVYPHEPVLTGTFIRESRLRRIPPLSELESTETKEETPA